MTAAAGLESIKHDDYYMENCKRIIDTREFTTKELLKEGFKVIPSSANFIFIKADFISGKELYSELYNAGILVRHFETERLKSYNRVTIGSREEMEAFLREIKRIKQKES